MSRARNSRVRGEKPSCVGVIVVEGHAEQVLSLPSHVRDALATASPSGLFEEWSEMVVEEDPVRIEIAADADERLGLRVAVE